jgi:hypothetical protein
MSFDEREKKTESNSQQSSSDQDKIYEKTKEYIRKQEQLEINRLRKVRWWVLIVLSYWVIRFFLIQRPKFKNYNHVTKFNVVLQGCVSLVISLVLIYTKLRNLTPVKYILYI